MFNNSKYTLWYHQIINKARLEPRKKRRRKHKDFIYYELHHILPRKFGGDNSKENTVLLTAREHYICHLLLIKMCIKYTHRVSMLFALNMMKNTRKSKGIFFNSYLYEKYREEFSKIISITNTGRKGRKVSEEHKEKLRLINTGRKASEETKQRISENHHDVSGKNNPMYGKQHKKETKRKISERHKNNPRMQAGPLNINRGRKANEETKRKISEHGKIKWNNGSREKMINTLSKGTYVTPWGEFVSAAIAIKHPSCPYKDKQNLAEKCRKNKKGFYFIPKEPIS